MVRKLHTKKLHPFLVRKESITEKQGLVNDFCVEIMIFYEENEVAESIKERLATP